MKKTNNKGFSLVELIIVIAIMAILIGVLAPQYIKYVEKSRVSADKDLLDSVYTACTTAASDPDLTSVPTGSANVRASLVAGGASTTWAGEVLSTLGATNFTSVESKLKSKVAKNHNINVEIDAQGNFTVWAGTSATNANANSQGIVVGAKAD